MDDPPEQLPLNTRIADRVAQWVGAAEAFRRAHPRLVRRLVDSYREGVSLEDFCAEHGKSFRPFDSPAGLQFLLSREGVDTDTGELDRLAAFAFTEASRVEVLRAGVALRRVPAVARQEAAQEGQPPPGAN